MIDNPEITVDVLSPGHPAYEKADAAFMDTFNSSQFYNDIAEFYNKELGVGEIAFLDLPPRLRFHNVKRVLLNRGVSSNVDILIGRSNLTANGQELPPGELKLKIKKLTQSPMRKLRNSE